MTASVHFYRQEALFEDHPKQRGISWDISEAGLLLRAGVSRASIVLRYFCNFGVCLSVGWNRLPWWECVAAAKINCLAYRGLEISSARFNDKQTLGGLLVVWRFLRVTKEKDIFNYVLTTKGSSLNTLSMVIVYFKSTLLSAVQDSDIEWGSASFHR